MRGLYMANILNLKLVKQKNPVELTYSSILDSNIHSNLETDGWRMYRNKEG